MSRPPRPPCPHRPPPWPSSSRRSAPRPLWLARQRPCPARTRSLLEGWISGSASRLQRCSTVVGRARARAPRRACATSLESRGMRVAPRTPIRAASTPSSALYLARRARPGWACSIGSTPSPSSADHHHPQAAARTTRAGKASAARAVQPAHGEPRRAAGRRLVGQDDAGQFGDFPPSLLGHGRRRSSRFRRRGGPWPLTAGRRPQQNAGARSARHLRRLAPLLERPPPQPCRALRRPPRSWAHFSA